MATGSEAPRDGNGPDQLIPPGQTTAATFLLDHTKAPVDTDGGFSIAGIASLAIADAANRSNWHYGYLADPAYAEYMNRDKGLIAPEEAGELEATFWALAAEERPRYLVTAGWAAAESALMNTSAPVAERLRLLDRGVATWQRAFETANRQTARLPAEEVELYAMAHRVALDIATAPLIAGMIAGELGGPIRRQVFEDCLRIGRSNLEWAAHMKEIGNFVGLSRHQGVGYEVNTMLLRSMTFSPFRVMIPSTARCDSGYYNGSQTHDLMELSFVDGKVESALPIEVKSKARLRDIGRLKALIVQKADLATSEGWRPEYLFDAIEQVYYGTATKQQLADVRRRQERIGILVNRYRATRTLGDVASKSHVTKFHDGQGIYGARLSLARTA